MLWHILFHAGLRRASFIGQLCEIAGSTPPPGLRPSWTTVSFTLAA
jgi:hypothetical protein